MSVSVGALSGGVWRTNFTLGDYLPSPHTPLPAALSTPFKLTPLTLTVKQLRKYIILCITVILEESPGYLPFVTNFT